MVIILLIVIAFLRIYVLLSLVCNVKVGQPEPEQPKESVFDFPKNGKNSKVEWKVASTVFLYIGFVHTVIFRELK